MQERNLCSQRTGELFPRKCFLKDILLNRNFQKPQAFCELAIASVNFPVNVHYTYRRQRGFTLCCTAAMPSSSNLFFSILSSSRCCWSFANSRIRSFSSSISLRSCSFRWKVKYRQQRNEPPNTSTEYKTAIKVVYQAVNDDDYTILLSIYIIIIIMIIK